MNHYSRYPSGEDPPGRISDILIGAEAEAELHRMETSGELLRFSLFRGHVTSMDFRHPHYPRTTPGVMYWFSASKVLRDLCVPSRNLSTTMGHSTGLIREQCPVW